MLPTALVYINVRWVPEFKTVVYNNGLYFTYLSFEKNVVLAVPFQVTS
jgi:hypothetical protein